MVNSTRSVTAATGVQTENDVRPAIAVAKTASDMPIAVKSRKSVPVISVILKCTDTRCPNDISVSARHITLGATWGI